jgi:hypothetical protein
MFLLQKKRKEKSESFTNSQFIYKPGNYHLTCLVCVDSEGTEQ